MLLHGFIAEFNPKVFRGIICVFIISLFSHTLLYFLARQMFKKAPDRMRKVLQFGVIFSNAGYMGIPIINDVFGSEFTIYATVYIIWFNVFSFSLGRMIFTEDKRFISIKKILINPAVVPIMIGMVIYLSGFGGWISQTITKDGFGPSLLKTCYDVITMIKATVAPTSMIVIGAKLADIKFGGILKDKYLYPFVFVRMFFFPTLIWAGLRILYSFGIIDMTVMSIVLILSATPAAAMTTMFAELYDADSAYGGKLVAITTILTIITMPIIALLLKI
jgi:predicted permease